MAAGGAREGKRMTFLALGALSFGMILGFLLPAPAFLVIALAAIAFGIVSAVSGGASFAYVVSATLCVLISAHIGYVVSLGLQAFIPSRIIGRWKRGAMQQRLPPKIGSSDER